MRTKRSGKKKTFFRNLVKICMRYDKFEQSLESPSPLALFPSLYWLGLITWWPLWAPFSLLCTWNSRSSPLLRYSVHSPLRTPAPEGMFSCLLPKSDSRSLLYLPRLTYLTRSLLLAHCVEFHFLVYPAAGLQARAYQSSAILSPSAWHLEVLR